MKLSWERKHGAVAWLFALNDTSRRSPTLLFCHRQGALVPHPGALHPLLPASVPGHHLVITVGFGEESGNQNPQLCPRGDIEDTQGKTQPGWWLAMTAGE